MRDRLEALGREYVFLNQADVLETNIDVSYGQVPGGTLDVYGRRYRLEEFDSFFLRPYDFRQFPELRDLGPESDAWRHAIRFEDIFWGYADITPALVVNRPSSMLSNNSKPFQCRINERFGFRTPRTLLTTDADAARRFRAVCGSVIYKSISGTRSIVRLLTDDDNERLGDLRWCPTQFQQEIRGDDFRIHVVGDRVFTTQVVSAGTDYRYTPAAYSATTVPEIIERRAVALTAYLGLHLSGIDLRRTADDEWFCFEVNPCPAYSCYEAATGQHISAALVDMLSAAHETRCLGSLLLK